VAKQRHAADAATLLTGIVIAAHGRHCVVETPDGKTVICHPRGKKSQSVVGDRVRWQPTEDQGTIEKVDTRRNLFYRQDEIRTKSFAANLDQVLILIAAEPEFSESQLARALIAAEAERIAPIIALNKSDLGAPFERAWTRLAPYRRMHYGVLPLALNPKVAEPDAKSLPRSAEVALTPGGEPLAHGGEVDRAALQKLLAGKTTLVLGPSGAGKSTLINLLVPGALVLTREISQALNSGKHTTTSTSWYWVDKASQTALIDSPGFQEFGLNHIEPMQLAKLMPDIAEHATQCKFYNCTHLHEPGCGVMTQVETAEKPGPISASRYRIYGELFEELSQRRY
jgi:ribosome biogenesis GTPase